MVFEAFPMKLKDWLVPREEKFFELLEEQSVIVLEGTEALVAMLSDYKDLRAHKTKIKEIEHRGDMKTHDFYNALNATFITPLDREDLASLTGALDDILDFTDDVAKHLYLYEVKTVPKEMVEVALMLRDQAKHLVDAMKMLPEPSQRDALQAKLVEIHRLENSADELTDRMKHDLFLSDDVKHILKMKDVLEYLETATDKAEDAADVVRDILVKHQ
ncbi:MAG TPA: DUF47 family protein [Candidatus Thermoplasmatota archaeon]|nr:DUF47 family protein [Candidatus Thermoplasmatota archaeon]